MDTLDELRAEAWRERQNREAAARGEPLPYSDPEPEPIGVSDVLHAANAWANLWAYAQSQKMPAGSAAWGNASRAYGRLVDVVRQYGEECARTGEVE